MTIDSYYALVIGCGRIGYQFKHLLGEVRSHLGAIRAVTDKRIACCDIDIKKAKAAGECFGIDYFGSVKEALADKIYDVMVVATPTNTHVSVISEICDEYHSRMPKIIVCEKPIAMNREQGEYIIKACRENGIKLVVNHNRRYHPAYKYVKEQLDKEIERNVRAVVGYCYGDPVTVGVHMWDLLDWYSYGDESVCHYIDLEAVKYKWWEVSIHTRSNLYRIIETAKETC
jgi:predicted dehydrogenase